MRVRPHAPVLEWLDAQVAQTLYLSSVTLAELLFGIAVLPPGRRREGLSEILGGLLQLFDDRVLSFDAQAAQRYAEIAAAARAAGKVVPVSDGYIAAMASVRGFAVATRDTAPFEAAGVPVINPWEAGG